MHKQGRRQDLIIIALYILLPILFLWPVTIGGQTMVPADNVFVWEPWASYADEAGVDTPQNDLLSDLYLENYAWKEFISESVHNLELPLWNPYIFGGMPFLAGGQHSAMYPLSILFYVIPVAHAYGWFAALHLALAGAFVYLFCRTLRLERGASFLGGLAFMFGGFMVIRNVFPMIIAAAVWLPFVLAMIELIIRKAEEQETRTLSLLPYAILGAIGYGMVLLAGHPEMYYYIALASVTYALFRLSLYIHRQKGNPRRWKIGAKLGLVLVCMAGVGVGLGAAQLLPLYELVQTNFRSGSASFQEVLSWAYPIRRVISLFIPNFFGNPSAHSYYDLFTGSTVSVTVNALGEQIDSIYWGIKNYVEGASYIGILPALLALIGLIKSKDKKKWFFAVYAALSLLFMFGTPLYYLVYKLPGLNQVHSPFRWVYTYSLFIAILVAYGAHSIITRIKGADEPQGKRFWQVLADKIIPWAAVIGGGVGIIGLGVSLLFKEQVAQLAEKVMYQLTFATNAFSDGAMFYSYEFPQFLLFFSALLLGGLLLLLRKRFKRPFVWVALAATVICGELWAIGMPFFTHVDADLVAYETPAIEFLQQDDDLFRITTLNSGDEKTLNANMAMIYGLYDIRGYDSIISKQYVNYMSLLSPQFELDYNRIAPLTTDYLEALDSPLLDALNVKYVLTAADRTIDNENYQLVYDGEIRIYENLDAMPRAYLVSNAVIVNNEEGLETALLNLDPKTTVVLEGQPDMVIEASETVGQVTHIDYTANEVTITVHTDAPSYLVLADTYFDGWKAYIREAGCTNTDDCETELGIYRANGNFRAVTVPAGEYVIRFKYSPMTIKIGLYVTFVALVILLLAFLLWLGQRYYRNPEDAEDVTRVSRNAVTPMLLQLLNKIVDMVFAMLMLRILGPTENGEYALAIVIIGWFDILTNFGLNPLLMREIARDRSSANKLLSNATALRLLLSVASVPVLGAFIWLRQGTSPLPTGTIMALGLFALGMLPSNIASGFAAVFQGYERMEIPAFISTVSTVIKVTLGAMVLLAGMSYVGLAGVSIATNIATAIMLAVLMRRLLFRPHAEFDWSIQKWMFKQSYPLMINNLLATLFFKVAVVLLEWILADSTVVGWYNAAYKYVDAVQIVPAYLTMAVFPVMSRYAVDAKESLIKAYRLSCKVLLLVAIPGALIAWALATPLISILAGSEFLPESASILSVMIWYMPFGFLNSVTQYVLIALNRQNYLTRAFAIGLTFNLVANLILINQFGYMASAWVTIASEIVLLVPFTIGINRYLEHISWFEMLWRHVVAALPLITAVTLLDSSYRFWSVLIGLVVYGVLLKVLKVFNTQETAALGRVINLDKLRNKGRGLLHRIFDHA